MIGNPEFTRNLWLQLSWQRVLGAAAVIGIIYYASTFWGEVGQSFASVAGKWLFHFVIGLWSTRRAADALAEEVGGNTWEVQRMSGLSAWQMAWGKLLGGTAYPWLCGLFCLALMDAGLLARGFAQTEILYGNANLIASGLTAQAVSLSVALILLRKVQLRRRLMVTFAQVCGLLVYANSLFGDVASLVNGPHLVSWYGNSYPATPFHLASLIVFGCWMWLGLYRLMRQELQYSNWPWAWLGFLAYAIIYIAGFEAGQGQPVTAMLVWPLITLVLLTYFSFLADPKDPVRYRWGLSALQSGDIGKALSLMPLWPISYVVTLLVGVVLAVLLSSQPLPPGSQDWLRYVWSNIKPDPQVLVIATLLFLARDLLFLLLLNFGRWRERADLAGLVYLLIAYFPLAAILSFVASYRLLAVVIPFDAHNTVMSFGPVLVEILVLGVLVARRWQSRTAIRQHSQAA